MSHGRKVIIGVGGTIGSGKTTVCRIFQEYGAGYISADEIGWEVLDDISHELRAEFGDKIMKDEKIDRRELRKHVFARRENLDFLNDLSHPILIEKIKRYVKEEPGPMVVLDAALLFTWPEILAMMDYSILVRADLQIKEKRTLKRGIGKDSFLAILNSQMDEDEMAKQAQFIINNDGTIESLKIQCREIYKEIKDGY